MLRAFVFPQLGAAEPLTFPGVDILACVALLHVLLIYVTAVVHVDHVWLVSELFIVGLCKGCQLNSSHIALMLSSVRRVVAYSSASQDDLLVGLASYGCFA